MTSQDSPGTARVTLTTQVVWTEYDTIGHGSTVSSKDDAAYTAQKD